MIIDFSKKSSTSGMSRLLLGTRTSSSALSAQHEFSGGSFPLKPLSVLTHAVRTGTSAFPAHSRLVTLSSRDVTARLLTFCFSELAYVRGRGEHPKRKARLKRLLLAGLLCVQG